MNNSYLMIEILGNIVFFMLFDKDINIQNLLKQRRYLIFQTLIMISFGKYYEALVECINKSWKTMIIPDQELVCIY